MDIGSLTGSITLDDAATSAIEQLEKTITVFSGKSVQSFRATEAAAEQMSAKIKDVGGALGKVFSIVFTAPILAAGGAAVAASMEITGAMSTIARSTGTTGAELEGLQQIFKNVFVQVGESAIEVATVLGEVYKRTKDLSLTGPELEKLTKQFIDFASVNRIEVTGAAKTVSTMMNALEIDMSEVGSVMDKLTYASQQSGMSVDRLAHGVISGGIAFKEMGFGLDQSIALFAQFEKVGANVTDVTSSLAKVMAGMAKDGVTDFAGAFQDLMNRIKDAPTYADASRLSIEAFGAKAGPKLTEEIRGGTYSVDAFVAAMKNAKGIVTDTAAATEPFTDKLLKLRHQLSLALEPLGKKLIDTFTAAVPAIEKFAGFLTNLVTAFGNLPQPVQTATFAFLGLLALLGPTTLALSSMVEMGVKTYDAFFKLDKLIFAVGNTVPVLTARLWLLAAAEAAATFPLIPIAAVLGAVTAAVIAVRVATGSWTETLKTFLIPGYGLFNLLEWGIGKLGLTGGALHDIVRIIKGSVIIGFEKLKDAVRSAWETFETGIVIIKRIAKELTEGLGESLASLIHVFDTLLPQGIATGLKVTVALMGVGLAGMKKELKDTADLIEKMANEASGKKGTSTAGSGAASGVSSVADEAEAASERVGAATNTLATRLQRMRAEAVVPLSASVQEYIQTANAMEMTQEEIFKGLKRTAEGANVTETQVKLYIKALEEGQKVSDAYSDKITDLTSSLRGANSELQIIQAAFKNLEPAQLKNFDVLQRLVPELDKLRAAGVALTTSQEQAIETYTQEKMALRDRQVAMLESQGVTASSIEALQRAGLAEEDIARKYKTTTAALNELVRAEMDKATREQSMASFTYALVEQEERARKRREEAQRNASNVIASVDAELQMLLRRESMTTTEIQVQQIQTQAAEWISAFSISGASAQQIKAYTQLVTRLTRRQTEALTIDQNALAANSRKTLDEIALKAKNTYEAMAAHPEKYSKATIQRFKEISESAAREASETASQWRDQLDTMAGALTQLAQVAGDSFGGIVKDIANVVVSWNLAAKAAQDYGKATTTAQKAAAVAAGAIAVAQATSQGGTGTRVLGGALSGASAGAMFGPYGAAIGAGIGAVVGLFRGMSAEAKAAKAEQERLALQTKVWAIETDALRSAFFLAAGGMTELNQRAFTAGVTLTRVLDAKTPETYKAAIDELNAALEFQDNAMKLLDDTAKKYGLTLSEMGPQYRQGKLDEEFRILYQDQQVLMAAGVDYDLILRKQVDTYRSLIQIALETGATIPLAMQPAIMRMDELGLFVDEAGNKMLDITKLNFAETLDAKFETLIETIGRLVAAIERGLSGAILAIPSAPNPFRDWQIPEPGGPLPGGRPLREEPAYFASGGPVWTPKGTDTVPAMLTPGERVLTVAEARSYDRGGQPLIIDQPIKLDGRKIGRNQVKVLPRELDYAGF